jgi:hypothetical protein
MALRAFLDQTFDQYFPEIPVWVNKDLFSKAWSEQLLEELLDNEGHYKEDADFEFTLTDSLVVPFSVEEFDPSGHGGVNNQIDPILVPNEVRAELRRMIDEQEETNRQGKLK